MSTKREQFVKQGEQVLRLAWEIGGSGGVEDEIEAQARIRNGLYAIVIVEIMARPVEETTRFGSLISLREVLKENDNV